ncbi:E3 ubiquitin-protein ligase RFWD3-like isoform X2 [Brevipalpus obovatus]|uniref:E3 ubiquitin-protein ligase RFWD3-like isoform X2 n=1 Tax=Brevipalpus obovatus TaxID=246614 RepID=UPI003D9E8920
MAERKKGVRKKKEVENQEEENEAEKSISDDGIVCNICCDVTTTEPGHRITSLKCGHLFGEKCINRWIEQSGSKQSGSALCPNCNHKIKKDDVWIIYAKNIKIVDSSEETAALQEVEKEKSIVRSLMNEKNNLNLNKMLNQAQIEEIKEDLRKINQKIQAVKQGVIEGSRVSEISISPRKKQKIEHFKLLRGLDLGQHSESRVITSSDTHGLISFSQRNRSGPFPDYGLKSMATEDFVPGNFIPLHRAPMKDIVFHPYDALILSASMDKTLKLTNLISCSITNSYEMESAVWSCAWNPKNTNLFYAGLGNGKVVEFDARMSSPVREIKSQTSSTIVSLKFVDNNHMCGLIATQLRASEFYRIEDASEIASYPIPIEGSFISADFENSSSRLLLSSRPITNQTNMTHSVFHLSMDPGPDPFQSNFHCDSVAQFIGGRKADQMLKSIIFPHPNDPTSSLVCTGDQDLAGFYVWDTNSSKNIQEVSTKAQVYDLSFMRSLNSHQILLTLSENSLDAYQWHL